MIKELGPVFCVGGGPKDVHHHEVLDVVLLPPWLFQLVDIVPELLKKSHVIPEMCTLHPVMFESRDTTDFWSSFTLYSGRSSPRHHKKLTTITIILHINGAQP